MAGIGLLIEQFLVHTYIKVCTYYTYTLPYSTVAIICEKFSNIQQNNTKVLLVSVVISIICLVYSTIVCLISSSLYLYIYKTTMCVKISFKASYGWLWGI